MIKYIKDLFMLNSKKNSSLKEALSFSISFKENQKSLILRNCAEPSLYDQAKYKKSYMKSCHQKLNATTSFFNLFAQWRGLRSDTINPEDCKRLNRLNSISPLSSMVLRLMSLKTFLSYRKCDAVQQVEEVAKGEMQPIPLSNYKQHFLYKEKDLYKVLKNFMKQRELKEGRALSETMNMLRDKLAQFAYEETNDEIAKKMIDKLTKLESAKKSSGNIQIVDKKVIINTDISRKKSAGIIDIDNVLKKEVTIRKGMFLDKPRKAPIMENNRRLDRSKVTAEETNYLRDFIELNRILDRKIMNSKEQKPTNPTKIVGKKEPK